MKYIHYFTAAICTLIFLIIVLYASPLYIINQIRYGFYVEEFVQEYGLSFNNSYVYIINRFIGLVFWTSIFINVGLLLFKKINIKTKGKISLISLIILLLIIFSPKMF
ncbi:hypothetical protein GCM10010984_04870 [Chishuiella changwenlii]|uniref:Uncharacterized protein n=1 Tax=Chishuiella changwenlii TaxID=1434701 RepID=A0ABQ1TE41_9FLAO|nr:hypothetical protein GCM10010984_04870 [Chishuiella changwenlii]